MAQDTDVLGGAILGVCAGLLWTASGFIHFAYAEEKDKAKVSLLSQDRLKLANASRSTLRTNGY